MRLRSPKHALAAAVAVAGLAGCAAPGGTSPTATAPPPADRVPMEQVRIESRFAAADVTRDGLYGEMRRCLPPLAPTSPAVRNALRDFPSRDLTVAGHASSASTFFLMQATALCLRRSANGFPIFAGEALPGTVNPAGVPPDVTEAWYRHVARLIAAKGSARVAYVFENGNAFDVTYWVERPQDFVIRHSSVFRKAGSWEATDAFDVKFTHPALTAVSSTKRSGQAAKAYPLSHRFN